MTAGRLFVPAGADDRRIQEAYKGTRIGYVVDPAQSPEQQCGIELVSFDASAVPTNDKSEKGEH